MASINIHNIEEPAVDQSELSASHMISDDHADKVQGGLLMVTGCFEAFRRCDPPRFPGPIVGGPGIPDPDPVILLA